MLKNTGKKKKKLLMKLKPAQFDDNTEQGLRFQIWDSHGGDDEDHHLLRGDNLLNFTDVSEQRATTTEK